MNERYYCRIVARVSSDPQFDKISPEEQVAGSRAAIPNVARQLGIEIVEYDEPLVVAQSTDIIALDALRELRRVSPEYNQLCKQVEHHKFHFLFGRDASRVLGRTKELQSQVESFLRHHQVQVYLYNQIMPLVHPAQLDPRGRAETGQDMALMLGSFMARQEVAGLVKKRRDGMNDHADKGKWRLAHAPYGYEKEFFGQRDGKNHYGDLVRIESERQAILQAAIDYLNGQDKEDIGSKLYYALQNPASVGILVYGRSQRKPVMDSDGVMRVRAVQSASMARIADIAEAWLDDSDIRKDYEQNIIVRRGTWQPLFESPDEIDLWRQVQRERRSRAFHGVGRREVVHPLSGILRCDYCHSPMIVVGARESKRLGGIASMYGCKKQRRWVEFREGEPCMTAHIYENDALDQLQAALESLGELESRQLAAAFSQTKAIDEKGLTKQKQAALAAIKRWDTAYDKGAIEYDEWETKTAPHRQLLRNTEDDLLRSEANKVKVNIGEKIDAVRKLATGFDDLRNGEARVFRAELRFVLDSADVRDKEIVRLNLRG